MQYIEKIIFTDTDEAFHYAIREKVPDMVLQVTKKHAVPVEAICEDIRSFKIPNSAYVSPANSFLYFDGGIDLHYGKMFPKLQPTAQTYMTKYKYVLKGRHILPVGSSLVTLVDKTASKYIVASPTMTQPEMLQGEKVRYVFWAVVATLVAIHKFNSKCDPTARIQTIICPGMGTGCGDITYIDSAGLIVEAFDYFVQNQYQLLASDEAPADHTIYLCDKRIDE